LRTDGGGEFLPIVKAFPQIMHQTSCPHTPQQNGAAERKHRQIVELSLATMSHSSFPIRYWDEIFNIIVYLINRLPSQNLAQYKTLFNKDVDYDFLRVLGCLCYPLTRPYNKNKLELRSQPCVFIGYGTNQKGYRCLHVPTGRVYVSRNVQFIEHEFPFAKPSVPIHHIPSAEQVSDPLSILVLAQNKTEQQGRRHAQLRAQTRDQPVLNLNSNNQAQYSKAQAHIDAVQDPIHLLNGARSPPLVYKRRAHIVPPVLSLDPTPTTNGTQNLNTPSSPSLSQALPPAPPVHKPPPPVDQPVLPSHSMITRTRDRTYKKREYLEFVSFHVLFASDPTTFHQANKSPQWRTTMAEEINALAKNNTWTLVPLPPDKMVIGCKWIFKLREMLMDPLKDIKLVWLLRISIKYLVWILKRLTAP
jgi:hypothetical protein